MWTVKTYNTFKWNVDDVLGWERMSTHFVKEMVWTEQSVKLLLRQLWSCAVSMVLSRLTSIFLLLTNGFIVVRSASVDSV